MKVGDSEVRENLLYTKEHDWVKIEGERCIVGISDYAQKSLHEIVYSDLPEIGTKISQMQSLGSVESVKAVADVYSPISGEIVEVNEKLADSPELINESPYDDGWIIIVKPTRLEEDKKNLMKAKEYAEFLQKLSEE